MDNSQMTTSLRSLIQFAPLERKVRKLAEIPGWQDRVKAIAGPALIEYELAKGRRWDEAAPDTSRLTACLNLVTDPAGGLNQAELQQLQALLLGNEGTIFRQGAGPRISESHAVLEPAAVPRALARFFEWTTSQAFGEMHAIEQMTLCQVRLYEIWPFEAYSWLTADLFSLRVLHLKTALLPVLHAGETDEFQEALSEALRFITKPLVDLYRRGCERACDRVLGQL